MGIRPKAGKTQWGKVCGDPRDGKWSTGSLEVGEALGGPGQASLGLC